LSRILPVLLKIIPLTEVPLFEAESRACGTCTLCCYLMGVGGLNKPSGVWCQHVQSEAEGSGCGIYDDPVKPKECSTWRCGWLSEGFMPGHDATMRPDRIHAVLTRATDGVNWRLIEDPDHKGVGRAKLAEQIKAFLAADPAHYVKVTCAGENDIFGNWAQAFDWQRKEMVANAFGLWAKGAGFMS
jgi:hypothetical protein